MYTMGILTCIVNGHISKCMITITNVFIIMNNIVTYVICHSCRRNCCSCRSFNRYKRNFMTIGEEGCMTLIESWSSSFVVKEWSCWLIWSSTTCDRHVLFTYCCMFCWRGNIFSMNFTSLKTVITFYEDLELFILSDQMDIQQICKPLIVA